MSALICQHCGQPAFKAGVTNVFGAAEILSVKPPTIYALLAKGELSAYRISKHGRLRIRLSDLRKLTKRKPKVHNLATTAALRQKRIKIEKKIEKKLREKLHKQLIERKYAKLRKENKLRHR